jgi:aminopeptidase N
MKCFLFILFLFTSIVLSASDNYPRTKHIDVSDYGFTIYLTDSNNIIRGQADILILHKGTGSSIVFDLISKSEDGKGMNVEQVLIDGEKVVWDHRNDRIFIEQVGEKIEGDISHVQIKYSGIPKDGLIISKNKHGERTFFADNWPDRARNWIPCIDHPSDKARVEFKVYAPDHYKVVSNGILVEESYMPERQKFTHWKEEVSIPTKVMVIGVASFASQLVETVDGVDIWTYVFKEDRSNGFSDYAIAIDPFKFYTSTIGPYPYKKLANVQSKTKYGGMENAGCIFYSERSVTGKNKIEGLMAHEIAHQWFGTSVSELDWHHIWLSEGFATYFTAYYFEKKHGTDRMKNTMQQSRLRVIGAFERKPAPVIDTTITNLMRLLSTNSYQKGAWVLHMLRAEIGEEAFISGVRLFYKNFRDKNALTTDFQNVVEDVSGVDLTDFFHQWLYQAELPALSLDWDYNDRRKETTVTIKQKQESYYFNIPLEIEIICEGVATIKNVRLHDGEETIVIKTESQPEAINLDPHIKLLYIDVNNGDS